MKHQTLAILNKDFFIEAVRTEKNPPLFISLYDYLGKPAGGDLGKKVNKYAQFRKQPYKSRFIHNPNYNGSVFLYTKEFLDEFFKVQKIFS